MPTFSITGTLTAADATTILAGAISGSFTITGAGPDFTVLNGGITAFQLSVRVGSTVTDPAVTLVFDAVASGTIFTSYNSDTGQLTVPSILAQIVDGNALDTSYPFFILLDLASVIAGQTGSITIRPVEGEAFATGTFHFAAAGGEGGAMALPTSILDAEARTASVEEMYLLAYMEGYAAGKGLTLTPAILNSVKALPHGLAYTVTGRASVKALMDSF